MSEVKRYTHHVTWGPGLRIEATMMALHDRGMYVLASDYDALHAEAEALRAENGRLSEELDKTELRALKFIHQCNAHVDLYRELKAELDQLSTQLEAARGLLRDIFCTCNLRELPSEHAIRDISNQIEALLTATPAPEVRPDLIRFDFINADGQQDSKMITHDEMRERYAALAEQGERQEAQVMARVHHNPDHPEPVRAVLNSIGRQLPDNAKLYAEPQPGPDVRGLVEAMNFACKSLCHVTSSDGSGHADIALSVLRMAGVDGEERERLVEGWKASCQWRIDKANRQAQQGGSHDR